jgi:hypothetical protein
VRSRNAAERSGGQSLFGVTSMGWFEVAVERCNPLYEATIASAASRHLRFRVKHPSPLFCRKILNTEDLKCDLRAKYSKQTGYRQNIDYKRDAGEVSLTVF